MIYLDHNSTTKLAPEALAKMNEVYALPLNASANHTLGRQANKILDDARETLKTLLNAKNYEVIFTGSSTEATNTVMFGCDAKKILFCQFEHSSVYNCRPADKEIIEIEALENGLINIADLEKKLPNDGNFLVSTMLANNETGAIQPIAEISKLVHQKGGLFHCDVVQAAGKIDVDLEKLNVDFASISAHKINGPQGVGALLIRKGLEIKPLIHGGKQEKSKRAGTSNVAGIAGFGEACKLAAKKISTYENVKKLRDFLETEIQKIAGDDVKIFATKVERLPNTSYIAMRNADAQTQLINFDLNKIYVSAGPACSSGTLTESRILKAMNIEPAFSTSAIRVSLNTENTKDEIEKFIKVWEEFFNRTRKNVGATLAVARGQA
jgi:cysteine desulfurase